jgi:hypothetical protein
MFSPARDRGAYAIMAGDLDRSVNGRGGLPLRQERKDELTSHDIWRMVMYYRLFHFDCTLRNRNTICNGVIETGHHGAHIVSKYAPVFPN